MEERSYGTRQHAKVAGLHTVCDEQVSKTLAENAVDSLMEKFQGAVRLGTTSVLYVAFVVLRRNSLGDHGKYADYWKERVTEGSEIAVALPVGPNELTSQVWFDRSQPSTSTRKAYDSQLTVLTKETCFQVRSSTLRQANVDKG